MQKLVIKLTQQEAQNYTQGVEGKVKLGHLQFGPYNVHTVLLCILYCQGILNISNYDVFGFF